MCAFLSLIEKWGDERNADGDQHQRRDDPEERLVGRLYLRHRADRAGRAADLYLAKVGRLRVENLQKPPIRVFYQVAQRPLFTIGRKQVISEVVSLCGGINIFADLDSLAPVVSMETVLLRNPQVILSARTGSANPLDIWLDYPAVAAVRLENLYLVDASLLARAGLRLADGAAQVCRLLDQARRKIARTD